MYTKEFNSDPPLFTLYPRGSRARRRRLRSKTSQSEDILGQDVSLATLSSISPKVYQQVDPSGTFIAERSTLSRKIAHLEFLWTQARLYLSIPNYPM
jgi:hypothetical protein